jgi:glucoside 3-dehydrogenase (cytochrome c) catalytic subunit
MIAYDAIVVGSGMTGGWAAKELTEHGLETLVLEAGRNIEPAADYVEHVLPYQMRYRGWGDRRKLEATQPVQRRCYACDELGSKFFVDDTENPYTTPDGKPFLWIRGRHVGGRSIMWGRQSYRLSDLDFEANATDGHGVDWPIRYTDIARWYEYVEHFIGVSGQAEGLPQLPDGSFLPPMEMTCVERAIRERLAQRYTDRVLTIGRAAVLTQPQNGRGACHYCGPCERGCITRSYFSSVNATLPAARETGKLTLRPHSVVHSVIFDPTTRKATGVRVIDAVSGESIEFQGRIIIMAASALESTRILLNSATPEFSKGLANSSGVLGRYLMDHVMGGGAVAEFAGWEDRTTSGRRPNGIYLVRFQNVKSQHPNFLRGYAYQGGASRAGWGRGTREPGFGAEFKTRLRDPGPWEMSLYGFGECLPRAENYIELDPAVQDRWGIPALRINCSWSDNERAMLQDMATQAAEMLEAVGGRNVRPFTDDNPPGLTIHEMGTTRMGRDPKTSVLNSYNQCHDVANLFVVDGGAMASSGNQNPSLTYMALTARACDYIVYKMRRNEL